MGYFSFVLLLGLAWFSSADCTPTSCKEPRSILYKDYDWDHFLFVQQYPAGFCLCEKSCSYLANTSSWTMHGLWPSLKDTKAPNFCNQSATFDINEIKDLVPRLSVDWTNLLNNTAFDSFWAHEWCKHGTCSGMPDEHTFFKTILDYYDNNMFGNILQNQGIVPSDDTGYDVKDIMNAFQEELGAMPYSISCMGSRGVAGSILTQIGICLDKDMNVTVCPSPTVTPGCKRDNVTYPTSIYGRNH